MKRKIMYYTTLISCGLLLSGSIVYAQKVGKKTVTDYDGNIYHTVTIGKQTWMVENLKTTHYRNGDPITHAEDDDQWLKSTSGAYCNYDNDENNVTIYGRLYNRHAVTDSHGICPSGWHIPTRVEWKILESYLGGSKVA